MADAPADGKRSRKRRARDRDDSDDDSSSSESESRDGCSESPSSSDEPRRKKKSRKKKDKKKKKRSKKDKKAKKKKKKKKKKKRRRDESTSLGAVNQAVFGARGIIRPENRAHMYEKKEEFMRWLVEVKDKQPSMLSQRDERELFSEYCEDYNTCTLPDEKYYNIAAWEMEEARRRGVKSRQDLYDLDAGMTDEEKAALERRRLRDAERTRVEDARTRALMMELKRAKREDSALFREIEEQHRAKGPETFESIAKKRKAAKEAQEAAMRKKLYGRV